MDSHIFTGTAVQAIDRYLINDLGKQSAELMQLAGESAFALLQQRFDETARSMLVLCGPGNNGGDGFVVALEALRADWPVQCVAASAPKSEAAKQAFNRYREAGGQLSPVDQVMGGETCYEVVVDALLGLGQNGAPRGLIAELVQWSNEQNAFRLALDVPTGLDADTGSVREPIFSADLTITFLAHKLGLLTGAGVNHVGDLVLETLDVTPAERGHVAPVANLLQPPKLPSRRPDSHKGTYGHVVVVGGDNGMFGATLLAGGAALRSGAGKVTLASTTGHLDKAAYWMPELMSTVIEVDASPAIASSEILAVGPGLGTDEWGRHAFEWSLQQINDLVIDADALNLLAEHDEQFPSDRRVVLTPHPGEAARLLHSTTAQVQLNRLSTVSQIARKYRAICVLKGAGTLIADPTGRVALCNLGNPGMASAGMGDVLTGVIAALLAQGHRPFDAACAGVWLHAKAADIAKSDIGEAGLIATDVIQQLPLTLVRCQQS
ncbi:bifunctional NAD(P)H-hydrate repair enzyme [Arenicella chitinivorans]|uniref:Bifunctional NAD(P)H-hydrate repair enzyme n=1 Tax=Arenicella chitinivorans TaxID=1329800 RepID=A0A918RJ00_9GAMM|nr:NAD(P)H-hydrate dehydratase [Arenicella chitinivorans]GGZ98484.1 bifunctional NAD(P)H-hydrate repair enzyme [Arenicella chitinivorans]